MRHGARMWRVVGDAVAFDRKVQRIAPRPADPIEGCIIGGGVVGGIHEQPAKAIRGVFAGVRPRFAGAPAAPATPQAPPAGNGWPEEMLRRGPGSP